MRVAVGAATLTGRAVDLRRFGVSPAAVARAVRLGDADRPETDGGTVPGRRPGAGEPAAGASGAGTGVPGRGGGVPGTGGDVSGPPGGVPGPADGVPGPPDETPGPGTGPVAVECPPPGPVHEHAGVVREGMALSVRPALAAAARSRGHRAPEDEGLRRVRRQLSEHAVPAVDLAPARRRVAENGEEEAALRERAASLRGRVAALREVGADAGDAEAALAETTRRLSEVTTERVAAEQALRRARRDARRAREARARRLRLEDRAGNLARAARRHLAAAVQDSFARAVAAVPGDGRAGEEPGSFHGDPVTAALAVVRVAATAAPVVVACDRFPSAVAASACLDAPAIRL